jgi:hypothetical protein
MLIDSASADHASGTQAVLPSSAERPSETAGHTALANAVEQVTNTPMNLAAETPACQTGQAEMSALPQFKDQNLKFDHIDSKTLFGLYAIYPSLHIREEIIQLYASRKSSKDWQVDWNNLALEYNATSLEFLLRVKEVKDRQAPHQAHRMNVNGYNKRKRPHFSHLMHASMHGDISTIERLLHSGADPYKRAFGWNALLLAADDGRTDAVRRLLQAAEDLLNIRTNFGMSALMLAVITPHIETIRLLLDKGIDANCSNEDGKTALIIAIENNNIDAIALLLPVTRSTP